LFSGLNADEASVAAPVFELHDARNKREERVVLALADVLTCLVLRAALAHQNRAGVDELPTEALDAQPWPCESRPFVEEPPPFLCAMTQSFSRKTAGMKPGDVKSYSLISLTCTAV